MMRQALVLSSLLLIAAPAFAHGLSLFATVEGDTIHAEATFTDGSPVKNKEISLLVGDAPLHTETTDEDGMAAFNVTDRQDYTLVLDLGDGHRATYDVKADYFPETMPSRTLAVKKRGAVDSDSLQGQINQLQNQIEELTNRVGFRDIVGGLGYIIGLVGIWAWFQSKRSRPDTRDDF